jgi:hypothetical protein
VLLLEVEGWVVQKEGALFLLLLLLLAHLLGVSVSHHYSQIFIGYVQLSVGELIASLDTVVEKTFDAKVLDHECQGVISFIPSLSAVIITGEEDSSRSVSSRSDEEGGGDDL